jgi:hypothetical protein
VSIYLLAQEDEVRFSKKKKGSQGKGARAKENSQWVV